MSPRGCWKRVPCHGTVSQPCVCSVSLCVCRGWAYLSLLITFNDSVYSSPSLSIFFPLYPICLSVLWLFLFFLVWTLMLNVTTYCHFVALISFPVSLMVPWCPFMFQAFFHCSNWSSSLGCQYLWLGSLVWHVQNRKQKCWHYSLVNHDFPYSYSLFITILQNGNYFEGCKTMPTPAPLNPLWCCEWHCRYLICNSCITICLCHCVWLMMSLGLLGDLWNGHTSSKLSCVFGGFSGGLCSAPLTFLCSHAARILLQSRKCPKWARPSQSFTSATTWSKKRSEAGERTLTI